MTKGRKKKHKIKSESISIAWYVGPEKLKFRFTYTSPRHGSFNIIDEGIESVQLILRKLKYPEDLPQSIELPSVTVDVTENNVLIDTGKAGYLLSFQRSFRHNLHDTLSELFQNALADVEFWWGDGCFELPVVDVHPMLKVAVCDE